MISHNGHDHKDDHVKYNGNDDNDSDDGSDNDDYDSDGGNDYNGKNSIYKNSSKATFNETTAVTNATRTAIQLAPKEHQFSQCHNIFNR